MDFSDRKRLALLIVAVVDPWRLTCRDRRIVRWSSGLRWLLFGTSVPELMLAYRQVCQEKPE
jgi:hypothetical protein